MVDPDTGEKVTKKWWALISKKPDKNGNTKIFKYFTPVNKKKKDENKPTDAEVEEHKSKIAYYTVLNRG